ncbi:DJ-1/PfpI family protein [Cetobacterium sp.]|uniref:DJ-1/PfpI family protein n=2 Tax=Cetobacterium sp. TaxID=2071632 RepID=UPI002FCAB525
MNEKEITKKNILFLLLDKWSDWEASYLSVGIQMLAAENYSIKTVAIDKKEVLSIGGFKTLCDYNLSTVPENYEALILIGGLSWRDHKYDEVKKIINQCLEKKRILGAICDAAGFLGTIGTLNEIKHTCNNLNNLKQWAGKNYLGEDKFIPKMAVSDNNVITANGTASLEFAREVLLSLKSIPKEVVENWYQFHKLGCYVVDIPNI